MSRPSLTFLGGVRTVTGSKFLVQHGGHRVLVDCGLFQGLKPLRERNWAPFPEPVDDIDAVVLTHAHLDHSGWLPRLRVAGFTGPIFATPRTLDLARIVLPDSGHLQEEEAAYANRIGFSRHHPALPLYTEADAWAVLDQFVAVPFHVTRHIAPGITLRPWPAGHILGSSIVTLSLEGGPSVAFSGDLGRPFIPCSGHPNRSRPSIGSSSSRLRG